MTFAFIAVVFERSAAGWAAWLACTSAIGSDAGMEKLDAICMQLIAIGESLKKFTNITGNQMLSKHPQIEKPDRLLQLSTPFYIKKGEVLVRQIKR